jgi:hypothetical protein
MFLNDDVCIFLIYLFELVFCKEMNMRGLFSTDGHARYI